MNERVLGKKKTSATPPQATQASSPLLHQRPFTDELSESFGSNSNISKELGGIQPKTIRRSLNWQNITVEAPNRSDGRSLPSGIQRQQEEPGAVIEERVSADSAQKSALELSNSTISTSEPAQKPSIARGPLNRRNIPIEAPASSAVATPDITLSEKDEDWEKAWRAKQEEVQSKMQQFVPRFQALDPNAEVHVKGSLASGVKLNPKKRSPSGEPYVFNPTDFDIDAYVKSNALYRQAVQKGAVLRKPGEIVGSKSKIPRFNNIIRDMRKELAKIAGNRDVGEEMFRFNVFIRTDENASSSIERDQERAKEINQDASIGNPLIIKEPNKE